jgi:hypothetical protein
MSQQEQHTFFATTMLIAGALLAWMGAFTGVYVFAAVACAKQFADLQIIGVPIVPVFTTATCALTAILSVFLLRRGMKLLRAQAADEHERFIGFVALATSGIAIFALVLLALPPLVTNACRT